MQVSPGAQWSDVPATVLPVPGQNRVSPGAMQAPATNKSQNKPGPQLPAPGQQTAPIGAQLNLLGQRNMPGAPGHGGPDVAVNCVPGGISSGVRGGTTNTLTGRAGEPPPRAPPPPPPPPPRGPPAPPLGLASFAAALLAKAAQSVDAALS